MRRPPPYKPQPQEQMPRLAWLSTWLFGGPDDWIPVVGAILGITLIFVAFLQ